MSEIATVWTLGDLCFLCNSLAKYIWGSFMGCLIFPESTFLL